MSPQIDFIGREETLQPKMLARTSTFVTLPMGTSSNLARLTLKPDTASKLRTNTAGYKDDMDFCFSERGSLIKLFGCV
jgi:hypothetical protein